MRIAAEIVIRVRWKIARRRGDISLIGSCPDCSLWTRVRNIFWKELDVILTDADSSFREWASVVTREERECILETEGLE